MGVATSYPAPPATKPGPLVCMATDLTSSSYSSDQVLLLIGLLIRGVITGSLPSGAWEGGCGRGEVLQGGQSVLDGRMCKTKVSDLSFFEDMNS